MNKISERLKLICSGVIPGMPCADVGTDHGKAGEYLLAENICPYVILTDVNEGPADIARRNMQALGFSPDFYEVRTGDGLKPLEISEVSTVIIAGMGGELIASILVENPVKTKSFKRFVLQPRTTEPELRKALIDMGLFIVNEQLVPERGRLCPVITAETTAPEGGKSEAFSCEADYIAPPLLFTNKDKYLGAYLDKKIRDSSNILLNLKNSSKDDKEELSEYWEDLLNSFNEMRKRIE